MDSSSQSYKYLFKFIIIGDMAVGKSCLNSQFLYGQNKETHDITIGVEFGSTIIKFQDGSIKLQIWDTAGQESFRSLTRTYYKSAIGALVVYDITRRETFNSLSSWIEEIQQNCNLNLRTLLIGNKCDLESSRKVLKNEGEEFAKENGMMFVETSVRDSASVKEAFFTLANEIYTNITNRTIKINKDFPGIKLGNEIPEPKTNVVDEPVGLKFRCQC